MRRIYIEKWCDVLTATHSRYVFSDTVDAGWILHVHNCYAHAPERKINDIIWLGVRLGGKDVLIRSRGGSKEKEGMSALRDFFVGELNQIFAYFQDAAVGDSIELHVVGCLIPLADFRLKGE